MHPLDVLKYHVTGAIERGEAVAITEQSETIKLFNVVHGMYCEHIADKAYSLCLQYGIDPDAVADLLKQYKAGEALPAVKADDAS